MFEAPSPSRPSAAADQGAFAGHHRVEAQDAARRTADHGSDGQTTLGTSRHSSRTDDRSGLIDDRSGLIDDSASRGAADAAAGASGHGRARVGAAGASSRRTGGRSMFPWS